MNTYKWIWTYICNYKFKALFGLILVIVVAAMNMVNPYLTGIIVDKVILGNQRDLLITILLVISGVTLVKTLFRYLYQMIFEYISQDILSGIHKDLYERLQVLDFNFYDKNKTGDIMARMTGDVDAVRHFVAWVIYTVFENITIFLFATFMLFFVNLTLALTLTAISPLIGFITLRFAKNIKPAFSAIRDQFSRLNSVVQETISGNRVVRALSKQEHEIKKFSEENTAYQDKNIDAARIFRRYIPAIEVGAMFLSVIMLTVGGILVIYKKMSLGELITFSSFIWALYNPMRMAGWLVNDVQRFAASGEKIMAFLQCQPYITNPVNPVDLEQVMGGIEYKNVTFGYQDITVLENITFKAEPGQVVAIVGPTGAGKTTLVSLICRFYDCTEGEILMDGIDIKKLPIKKLRSNIALAMQDVFLFSDTIEGNIAYGVPDATQREVLWAAECTYAHEFINELPEGYDTIVGERGVGLSGGQKQRIALARALLKNTPILILDDTTSSIDLETENKIQKILKLHFQNKTVFIIAHRISSVKDADLILVLNNKQIVEAGNHEDLLKKKGYYYSVYVNQHGDFDDLDEHGELAYGS